MEILDLSAVLEMLTSGGLIGVALVFIGQNIPELQRLSERTKFWLVFACFVIVPILAQIAIATIPPETIAAAAPYWRAAMFGLMGWNTFMGGRKLVARKGDATG